MLWRPHLGISDPGSLVHIEHRSNTRECVISRINWVSSLYYVYNLQYADKIKITYLLKNAFIIPKLIV